MKIKVQKQMNTEIKLQKRRTSQEVSEIVFKIYLKIVVGNCPTNSLQYSEFFLT